MSYGMSYGGDGYYADADYQQMYEEQEEQYEEPPQRQQNAPRSPGLRAHMKQMASENKALKKELEEQRSMLQELMEGDGPQAAGSQPGGYQHPRSPLMTPEEQMQYQRALSMNGIQAAPPMGTQAEQIARINNAQTPQELMDYLRSQGNPNYYNGA